MSYFKKNEFKIVGKLTNADVKMGNRASDGANYVSVKATITSNIKNHDNEFEVEFFAFEMTSDKKVSKLYTNYCELKDSVGKRLEVTGSFRENRYWSSKNNQLVSSNGLSGKFIKGVSESVEDTATFELGGFVVKTLTEKKNKDNEIYRYDLMLGQANYSENNVNMFTLHVNPEDVAIVKGVSNYQIGQTIKLGGSLAFNVVEVVKEEPVAFGQPITKTYRNINKNFYIESGSNPITEALTTGDVPYDSEIIRTLIDAYKANDVNLMANAKKDNKAVVDEKPVTTRQTSLV